MLICMYSVFRNELIAEYYVWNRYIAKMGANYAQLELDYNNN